MIPRLYTIEEAAAALHESVKITAIRQAIVEGRLPASKIGLRYYINEEELRRFATCPANESQQDFWWNAEEGVYVIKDGTYRQRTGYGLEQRGEAERALGDYLAEKGAPKRRGPADPSDVTVGEVLTRYVEAKIDEVAGPAQLLSTVKALAGFFGDYSCAELTQTVCKSYLDHRGVAPATARKDMSTLQAALNFCHADKVLIYPVKVFLPNGGEARDRWLTPGEAAAVLRAASPHVRRFILISLYTGRRASAVLDLTWTRVDLDGGVIRFRVEGQAETNKRRGQARINKLAHHLRRWRAMAGEGETHVVMWRGKPLDRIKTGIREAALRAGVEGVTPHVFKHTAITWAMQNGAKIEFAAEFFNTSVKTIRDHYWHHSPYHQEEGLEAVEARPGKRTAADREQAPNRSGTDGKRETVRKRSGASKLTVVGPAR